MPVVLVSSDSYGSGREFAERVAELGDWLFVDREILIQTAQRAGVEAQRLIDALDGTAPRIGRSIKNKTKWLTIVEQAVLKKLLDDGVVCHGLAAHLYVRDVSHALKVRVVDDDELARAAAKEAGDDPDKTNKVLKREEGRKRKWALDSYGVDEADPGLYDHVVDLKEIPLEDAAQYIVGLAKDRRFQPVTYSLETLQNLELAKRVNLVLMDDFPEARVKADKGTIIVDTKPGIRDRRSMAAKIKKLASVVEDVRYVEVHTGRSSMQLPG